MIDPINEVKKKSKSKKLILGTDLTIKKLKLGKISKVFISSNCPVKIVKEINYLGKLSKTQIFKLKQQNDELGTICKKPFSISVVSVKK